MRCNHWDAGVRCCERATTRLLGPNNGKVPGVYCAGSLYCEAHARAYQTEYREKLGEEWPIEPLTEQENKLP